jgi:hypothetical protein
MAADPRAAVASLSRTDFAYDNPRSTGWGELASACAEIQDQGAVLAGADDMFDLMERLDDVDLGSPGPPVHALESTEAAYEPHLVASIRRKPSPVSVWMVNRILNTERVDRGYLAWPAAVGCQPATPWRPRPRAPMPRTSLPFKPARAAPEGWFAHCGNRSPVR